MLPSLFPTTGFQIITNMKLPDDFPVTEAIQSTENLYAPKAGFWQGGKGGGKTWVMGAKKDVFSGGK